MRFHIDYCQQFEESVRHQYHQSIDVKEWLSDAPPPVPLYPDLIHSTTFDCDCWVAGWLADKKDARRRADENGQTETVCRCCDCPDELCYIDVTRSIGLFESKDGRETRKETEADAIAATHQMTT